MPVTDFLQLHFLESDSTKKEKKKEKTVLDFVKILQSSHNLNF